MKIASAKLFIAVASFCFFCCFQQIIASPSISITDCSDTTESFEVKSVDWINRGDYSGIKKNCIFWVNSFNHDGEEDAVLFSSICKVEEVKIHCRHTCGNCGSNPKYSNNEMEDSRFSTSDGMVPKLLLPNDPEQISSGTSSGSSDSDTGDETKFNQFAFINVFDHGNELLQNANIVEI